MINQSFRNCNHVTKAERVVTVVRVLFATKWKHEEKSCRDTLATVHDSHNSVVELRSIQTGRDSTTRLFSF
jgi:hypothetical protein